MCPKNVCLQRHTTAMTSCVRCFSVVQSPQHAQLNRAHTQRVSASAQQEPKYSSSISLAANKYAQSKAPKSGYAHPEGVSRVKKFIIFVMQGGFIPSKLSPEVMRSLQNLFELFDF